MSTVALRRDVNRLKEEVNALRDELNQTKHRVSVLEGRVNAHSDIHSIDITIAPPRGDFDNTTSFEGVAPTEGE